ncbi:choline dehydrogenase, mitochondrial-like [Ciona intestinalis]
MIGSQLAQQTIYNGQRVTSASSFLRSVIKERRERLHIVGRAHVRQIVFEEGEDRRKRASGVIYVRDDVEVKVRARKEVIVSGGAVGSPQLLMLSGIGPKQHLNDMGIPIVADLKGVGQNLRDHVYAPVPIHSPNLTEGIAINDNVLFTSAFQYLLRGTGPLGYVGVDAQVLGRSSHAKTRSPDIQLILLSAEWTMANIEANQNNLNYKQEYVDRLRKRGEEHDTKTISNFLISNGLLKPASVGYIKLRSSNYLDHPVIQPNYLSNQKDVEIMIEGFRLLEKLEKTKPFKEIGAKMELSALNCGDETQSPR